MVCNRSIGAFTNNPCPTSRTYGLSVENCSDEITVHCGVNTAEAGFVFPDGTGITTACEAPPFQTINYPNIESVIPALGFTIPDSMCGIGPTLKYLAAAVELDGVCTETILSASSELALSMDCLSLQFDASAGTCDSVNSGSILVTTLTGVGPF